MLLKSKKKLKINNKISKKNNKSNYIINTKIGGNKPLIFVQHNIGHIEYNIKCSTLPLFFFRL